jgi:hypothetical protein
MRALLAAALTTVVPTVVGWRFISGPRVLQWSLGAVVGIVLVAIGALLGGLLGSPLLGAAAMLLFAWFVGPRLRWDPRAAPPRPSIGRVVIVLLVAGGALMILSLFRPVPSWDAWFLWSLKAKGLASAGSFNSPVFLSRAYRYSSQDYPTLLPSWQALAYLISGDLRVSWPLQFQQAWLWTSASVALVSLTSGYGVLACLLPLAWIVTPEVVWQSMQGYADVPMALMLVLGTAVLWRDRFDPRSHVVAGILLAGAALTKSEGVPLVVIVLASLLLSRRPRPVLAVAPAIVIAARLPWFVFTQVHGLTNEMINSETVRSLILGQTPMRVPQIAFAMGSVMLSPIRWGLLVPACILSAALVRRIDTRLGIAALLGFVMFVVVYQATWFFQGSTLEAFVNSNVDRVLIAPLGILALSVGSSFSRGEMERELGPLVPGAALPDEHDVVLGLDESQDCGITATDQ